LKKPIAAVFSGFLFSTVGAKPRPLNSRAAVCAEHELQKSLSVSQHDKDSMWKQRPCIRANAGDVLESGAGQRGLSVDLFANDPRSGHR
jgi:hypothetical protein